MGYQISVFKQYKGQGLIEAIISLALLVGGIIGALTLATITIRAGTESRERIQAALLAQEGIEIVKNNRDTNWIKKAQGENVNWDNDLLNTDNFSNVGSLEGGNCGPEFEKFTRNIKIEGDPNNNDKKKITCTVSWADASGSYNVTVIDYITNWQKE